jgi:kynurenine formamidase
MIIDLTQTLGNGITCYPGTLEPNFEILSTVEEDGSAVIKMCMNSHTGTHMDAPAHFVAKSKTLDQIPIYDMIGKGYVVNCKNEQEISIELLKHFKNHIADAQYILFYTGWDQKWNTPRYLDPFPVLTEDARDWLLQFPLKGIGYDTISADPIDSVEFPNHYAILGNGILIIENLCHLDKLLDKSFEFYTIPLKIKDSDGSPVRAFAVLKD